MPAGAPASRGIVATAIVAITLIWGTTWAVIRIGLEGIPPLTGVAVRFGLAAAVLYALARKWGVKLGGARYERRVWIANGLLSFSISYGVVYWAEQWVPSGLSAVLFATYPLFIGILAAFFLRDERMGARGIVGSLIGFVGVAVIFSEDLRALAGPGTLFAAVVFLLAPLTSAGGSVVVKRWGKGIHPLSVTIVPMAIASVLTGIVAAFVERGREIHLDAVSVGAVLYLAVFGSAVTFGVYYWLLQHYAATRLGLIAYVIPVVAVLIGTVFLDEPFTARIAAGGVLVLGGVAMAARA